jgi:chloramphenicol-sensitive protein RarD
MNPGIAFATAAYVVWGVFPLYVAAVRGVPAFELLMHRMVWALVVLVVILAVRRRWRWVADLGATPRVVVRYGVGAVLIGFNWFVYIWSVQNGHTVDASLGYFITPLVSVLLGRVVLGERPRPVQWTAIAVAAGGVLWLGFQAGHVPWIGLALAATFGSYGLSKKTAPLGALEGLALETALLFPFAVSALAWLPSQGHSAMLDGSPRTQWLLLASGPLTALPLLLFAAGARRIPMTMLGLLQYIAPTLQLLIAVLVFHEAFGGRSLVGYAMIWMALLLYAAEGIWRARRPVEPVLAP